MTVRPVRNACRDRAFTALRLSHPERYREIYDERKKDIGRSRASSHARAQLSREFYVEFRELYGKELAEFGLQLDNRGTGPRRREWIPGELVSDVEDDEL